MINFESVNNQLCIDFMTEYLEALKRMPIFKMSLGSKELFHSNFLEFLWDVDHARFVRLVNSLLLPQAALDAPKDDDYYVLSRERENFDICIYHKRGRSYCYDLVIENKVKSLPDIDQLKGYQSKIKARNQQTRYLLLSLVENFGTQKRKEIEDGCWRIVHYHDLSKAIRKHYADLNNNYINDYCAFIECLDNLQKSIVPSEETFLGQPLFPDYDVYKSYRLHDLYIKCRGVKFMEKLKCKLDDEGIAYHDVKVGGDKLRKAYAGNGSIRNRAVFLNWNVYNAQGQIAAFIYRGGEKIYEIVIQADKTVYYKHGINYRTKLSDGKFSPLQLNHDESNKDYKVTVREAIWEKVKEDPFIKAFDRTSRQEFCGYGDDCVYRYEIVSEQSIGLLLDRMVEDVISIVRAV